MLMTVTRNLFRAYSANDNKPETIVAQINKTMSENNENSLFVTLFVGVLDLLSGRLLYCSAGHEPPLLISDKALDLPFVPAFPIGAFDDAKYQALEALIAPNTTLFLFTDGLNEAINTSKERFDRESIMVVAHQAIADGQLSPQSLIQRMEKAVETFVGEAEQSDDLTMLAIQRLSSDTICLKASSEEYPRMTAYVKGLADAVGLDTYRAGRLRLMIEETVGNIIDYSGATEITLTAHVTDQQLCVTIADDGQPFNPTTVPDPDLSVPGEKRKAGGLGTMLMRKMCDRITYRREEHQNVLEMYGTISSESLANSPDTISL
jgi:sigma-B regulation protein RsbU (phosphoserine phosphatase)